MIIPLRPAPTSRRDTTRVSLKGHRGCVKVHLPL
jgi:hypothetical protein